MNVVFSSIEFLLRFLPVFAVIYYLTPRRMRNTILVLGSIYFYAFGDSRNLLLLIASMIINFGVGRLLGIDKKKSEYKSNNTEDDYILNLDTEEEAAEPPDDTTGKKAGVAQTLLLFFAVITNVALLILFKWSDKQALPLGFSFYTFQTLSYLIDVYKREVECEKSPIRYAAYISMFPQLVSGPIVYYGEVKSALLSRKCTLQMAESGAKVFAVGLALKVLLADRVGILWNEIQTTGFVSISTPLAWLGAIAFSLQIYFDFYGYSLMAIGLGRMLGFELPKNFDLPYMARSVRDFYRRWHMTLGRWFCKYVYIPLGGSRRGKLRTVGNLLVVWLLTSFWHGDSLNFLLWGMSLWLLIAIEKVVELCTDKHKEKRRWKILPHIYICMVIPITWMFFAITDIREIGIYLGRMTGLGEGVNVNSMDAAKALGNYGLLLLAGIVLCTPLLRKIYRWMSGWLAGKVVLAVLFWLSVWRIAVEGNNPFMYFNF